MNQKSNYFSYENILKIWAGLTMVFAFSGLLLFLYDLHGKTFIVMSNTINLLLFLIFFLFRKKIEKAFVKLIDKPKNLSFSVKYIYEKQIGFTLFLFFVAICSVIIYLSLVDIKLYRLLIKEDGIVEYGSAVFWFFSAIIVFLHTLKLSLKKINKYQLLFNIILMIFFIVCFGEEISWGQRLFGIQTPGFLSTINVQNETTLHNIGSISVFSNAFFLLTIMFFLFVPFLIKKESQTKNLLYYLHFPIPNRFAIYVYIGSLFVWIFIGLRFGTLGFHPYSFFTEQYYTQMDDEIFELLAAYSFFCFSILNSARQIIIVNNYQDESNE